MPRKKNNFSAQGKVKMVFEGLTYPDGIAAYCRSQGIRDTLFYKWKNQLLTNANALFLPKKKETSLDIKLQNDLIRKDSIISELVEENIFLKKKHGI
jgi:transposase